MYRLLFSLVFSHMDPEDAHHLAFRVIRMLPALGFGRLVERFTAPDRSLEVQALGLRFPSPFGVAAGFDKDAFVVRGLGQLGFGHVEVGTITANAQPGNERPRLFRLVRDRALVNRMGFNNGGADAAVGRLSRLARRTRRPVLGVNIGKSRATPVEEAIADYERSARVLSPYADYLVVNVSSPNTPGLRGLQELDALAPLLEAVRAQAGATPLLVKIAPDLADDEIVRICELATRLGLDGIIATNTTVSREGLAAPASVIEAIGAGGLSGAPLAGRSLDVLRIVRAHVPAGLCVISVGGVETAVDVQDRLDHGATLVQGYSAFIYRGPLWARQVNRGLARIRRSREATGEAARVPT
ncbi:quinone-dependent dihydroorotate dehydrogenase [Agromyces sp. NPDC058484]|uniref:quinone-dependent dihydroorotate dehydrogenase n=1 Tax=Agromyces sp. NPDC058484 TaxID=3346524 RepID=UPI0036569E39